MIQYSPSQAMLVFCYDIVSWLGHFVRINSGGGMLLQFSWDSEFEVRALQRDNVVTEHKHCLAW